MNSALGLIETLGLPAAVEAADVAVKSANVRLVGYELARGDGMTTVKIEGDVGAVQAAVSSAQAAASKIARVVSAHVIPRPSDGAEHLVRTKDTVGAAPSPMRPTSKPKVAPPSPPPPPPLPTPKEATPPHHKEERRVPEEVKAPKDKEREKPLAQQSHKGSPKAPPPKGSSKQRNKGPEPQEKEKLTVEEGKEQPNKEDPTSQLPWGGSDNG